MSTISLPTKSDETCSNAFLLDENLCLNTSLGVINYNVQHLSGGLTFLNDYGQQWNNLFTIFANNSARWIISSTNLKTLSAKWVDTYKTVNALSANWCKEFSLYLPTMINLNYWNSISFNDQLNIGQQWLNLNFPPRQMANGQEVSLYVYLFEEKPFSFSFQRSLYEPCTPNGGGATVSCGQCPTPFRGCNHHGGRAGWGPCDNAYDYCTKVTTGAGTLEFSCEGQGAKTLSIGLTQNYVENYTAGVQRIRYINLNNTWQYSPIYLIDDF